jgi:hypothetical protein
MFLGSDAPRRLMTRVSALVPDRCMPSTTTHVRPVDRSPDRDAVSVACARGNEEGGELVKSRTLAAEGRSLEVDMSFVDTAGLASVA